MEEIKKQSTVDLAVEKLAEFIASDQIELGNRMPSTAELCRQLNISRTTVREAYRVLQSQGYLEIPVGKGAFVKSKKPNAIQEAFDWITSHQLEMKDYLVVRRVLDPLAAELAASNATEKDIKELCTIHSAFVQSVRDMDNEVMAKLDARFHERIAMSTGNDLLIALVRIVNHYFLTLRKTSFQVKQHANHAILPHEQILESIIDGDTAKAHKVSIGHIDLAIQDLCKDQLTIGSLREM